MGRDRKKPLKRMENPFAQMSGKLVSSQVVTISSKVLQHYLSVP